MGMGGEKRRGKGGAEGVPAISRFYGKREKGQGIQAKNFQEEKTKVAFA